MLVKANVSNGWKADALLMLGWVSSRAITEKHDSASGMIDHPSDQAPESWIACARRLNCQNEKFAHPVDLLVRDAAPLRFGRKHLERRLGTAERNCRHRLSCCSVHDERDCNTRDQERSGDQDNLRSHSTRASHRELTSAMGGKQTLARSEGATNCQQFNPHCTPPQMASAMLISPSE